MSRKQDNVVVSIEDATRIANMLKRRLLDKMVSTGSITQSAYDKFNSDTQWVTIKRSWFETWCIKKGYTKAEQGSYEYKLVNFLD